MLNLLNYFFCLKKKQRNKKVIDICRILSNYKIVRKFFDFNIKINVINI